MRRSLVLATGAALVAAALPVSGATAAPSPDGSSPAARGERPDEPDPRLSLLPDPSAVDRLAWDRYAAAQGDLRAARRPVARGAAPGLLVDETEPVGTHGSNDRPGSAQQVPGFGTADGANSRARVLGAMSPPPVQTEPVPPSREDDGSIPLARQTGIGTTRDGITTSGVIGDGPHGSARGATGDFDFYRVRAAAGEEITAGIGTAGGQLDWVLSVWDASGNPVAILVNDLTGDNTELSYIAPTAGQYYVLVSGFPTLPVDPRDPASGFGVGSEGPYQLRLTAGTPDRDFYSVRLRKGDVIGVSSAGAPGRVSVYDTAPRIEDVHGSGVDGTSIYPPSSPLPGGGKAVTEHVVDQDGWHYVALEGGRGAYDVTVEAYRPAAARGTTVQTIYLDFDGARLNTNIFFGPGVRTLSPLSGFLGRWGLRSSDLRPLARQITAEVQENLQRDVAARGGLGAPAIRVLNSFEHPDPWGQAGVSRVVVGGTIAESGIPTIGIAQSIDPGNFETEETALVLLDLLSEPRGMPYSLNTYLRPGSDRLGFVGQALGNVVSHEAGHFLGNWHVDPTNSRANLMDQGGVFAPLFGVGRDRVGGTADDRDVDFGEDVFSPFDGFTVFTGVEDTLTRTAVGLQRGR